MCSSVASLSWIAVIWHHTQGRKWIRLSADRYNAWTRKKTTHLTVHYLRNFQLLTYVFWVISVYFNIRNTFPKSGTFLLGHSVSICLCVCVRVRVCLWVRVFVCVFLFECLDQHIWHFERKINGANDIYNLEFQYKFVFKICLKV